MNSIRKTIAIFNMEELCLINIYAEISETIKELRNRLLHALHVSVEKEMLIVYGTVLYKLDQITEEEYMRAKVNNAFDVATHAI